MVLTERKQLYFFPNMDSTYLSTSNIEFYIAQETLRSQCLFPTSLYKRVSLNCHGSLKKCLDDTVMDWHFFPEKRSKQEYTLSLHATDTEICLV